MVNRTYLCLFLILSVLSGCFAPSAFAFPEMSRKGYSGCITCHVSPSGGGLLRDYGRVQAGEMLSARKVWEVKEDGPLSWGAQARGLQIGQQIGKGIPRVEYFLMQADAEAAIRYQTADGDAVRVDATIGFDPTTKRVITRRHYAVAQFGSWSFRVGKFLPFFGLGLPDHTLSIRKGIGLGLGGERYGLEVGRVTNDGTTYVTAFLDGAMVRQSWMVGNQQFGASISSDGFGGPFTILSFPYDIWLMGEALWVDREIRAYARLSWEPWQGVVLYLATQRGFSAFNAAGVQWFPIPGLELRTELNQSKGAKTVWLMSNVYL